jgi:hypothetical protein
MPVSGPVALGCCGACDCELVEGPSKGENPEGDGDDDGAPKADGCAGAPKGCGGRVIGGAKGAGAAPKGEGAGAWDGGAPKGGALPKGEGAP